MVNIRESRWSQWQSTLTIRYYSLLLLLLWIVSQGPVGGGFYSALEIRLTIANWPRRDDGRTRVFHRYCLRYVASNFNTHFQNSTLKSALLKAGYASQVVKFDTIMESIKQVEIEAIRNKKKVTGKDGKEKNQDYLPYTYLIGESMDMWSQSHDGGRRFGAMTTNISECFNGVLKGAQGLPYCHNG